MLSKKKREQRKNLGLSKELLSKLDTVDIISKKPYNPSLIKLESDEVSYEETDKAKNELKENFSLIIYSSIIVFAVLILFWLVYMLAFK